MLLQRYQKYFDKVMHIVLDGWIWDFGLEIMLDALGNLVSNKFYSDPEKAKC